jgi:AsmA protein
MNSLVKVLLAVVAAIVLVFVVVVVAVAFLFEPNDYRPFLVDSVQKATGRDFVLAGDLALKLFPCCGVRIGAATLGNPPGFPESPFASIEAASVSVKIWPLLTRREVQIGTVTLDGLDVHLAELADGRTNWTFENGETPAEPTPGEGPAIESLTVEGLQIRDGNVTYSGSDGTRYAVGDIRVDAGAIGSDAPVPVTVGLTARDESVDATAAIELKGNLGLSGDVVSVDLARLTVQATGPAVPTGQASAEVTADTVRYDTAAANGGINGLNAALTLPGTRVEASGEVGLGADAVTGTGAFRIPEGNLRKLLEALPDTAYAPAGKDALAHLTGGGRWALTNTGASLGDLDLNLDESRITGHAEVTNFETGAVSVGLHLDRLNLDTYLPEPQAPPANTTTAPAEVPFESLADLRVDAELKVDELLASGLALRSLETRLRNDGRTLSVTAASGLLGGQMKLDGSGNPAGASPALSGRLEVNGVSPRDALMALGEAVETANPDVLSRLSGSARWKLTRRSLALTDMSWLLDDTRLTGTLGIDDFGTAATRFDVALDHINLDDYLAPKAPEETAGAGADVEIPVEMIRGLDLTGQLEAAALRVMDLELTNLAASVRAKNGVLELEPLTADLYGGTYQGNIVVDATGAESKLSVDQQLSAVQVGQLLDALVGSDRIAGAMTLKLKGNGVGNTQNQILKALTGNVAFNLTDGVYHGMDIAYEIENAQSLFKRSAAPERPNRKETPIRALAFSGRIVDGILGSDDLSGELPHLKLGGKGGVNLVERTLDYQLSAQILKSADDATSRLKGLAGNTIPITIKGPMADPKVGVNLQGLVVETVKERARDELLKRLGVNQDAASSGAASGETGNGASAADSATATAPSPAATADAETGPAQTVDTTAAAPRDEDASEKQADEQPTARDLIEQGLRGLLKKRESEGETEK